MPKPEKVPKRVQEAVESLSLTRPMRRGSLGERWLKCGKPNCACATREEARHGPYFSLTRTVAGRTQSRRLTAHQADRVRRQVAAGRAFRQHLEAYWEACERWADAELAEVDTDTGETVQKRGSRRSSMPRSRPKSKS